jgi:hypothetical protein
MQCLRLQVTTGNVASGLELQVSINVQWWKHRRQSQNLKEVDFMAALGSPKKAWPGLDIVRAGPPWLSRASSPT